MLPKCENAALRSISREGHIGWLAGIIDGEGNIQASTKKASNGKSYFSPKIRIASSDIRMIERISEIYKENNIVFFYHIKNVKRQHPEWLNQLHIEVASQGSCLKVLELVFPFLVNKQAQASAVMNLIKFVQKMPKGGNAKSVDYINTEYFQEMHQKYRSELKWHVEPSTTTRKASNVFTW